MPSISRAGSSLRRPVDPVRNGPSAPPTTSTRMDGYTEMMLAQGGLLAMVGKAERGPEAVAAIRRHRAAYLIAVGGAAYLVSQAIRGARVVAFEDLGMEAIYEFDVVDMPVTVAVDAQGGNVHEDGPRAGDARRRAPSAASRSAAPEQRRGPPPQCSMNSSRRRTGASADAASAWARLPEPSSRSILGSSQVPVTAYSMVIALASGCLSSHCVESAQADQRIDGQRRHHRRAAGVQVRNHHGLEVPALLHHVHVAGQHDGRHGPLTL